jgi:hypothetical protein
MAAEIITTDELYLFKQELLEDIRKIFREEHKPAKKWLKSYEVRKILNISPGTLQNLRVNGTLPFTKIGGLIYYSHEDIMKVMEENKRNFNPLTDEL